MNTADPLLNQPSAPTLLSSIPTPALAEDPAPTRFLPSPFLTGYSEVNPFEASFAHPVRQTGPVTPNTATANLAVTTVKREFVKSLKASPVVDERFSGLHLLADESISTPPLPVFFANSSLSAHSNKPASTEKPPESTQSGTVSRSEGAGSSYAPKDYGHHPPAYDSRAVDTSVHAFSIARPFPSSLSPSSMTTGAHSKSTYTYASVPVAMAIPKEFNNQDASYGYSSQFTAPTSYQNGEESASSSSSGQNRKRSSIARSGDMWNSKYSSRSAEEREQKSRRESRDSSENRSSMSRNSKDDEGSNDEETPEEKRRRFLERNRMAASKCRQKKKLWVEELEHAADEITITNKNLQNLVSQLKEEVMGLKSQLLAHRNCNCNVIQHYVQSSGQFGRSGMYNSNLGSGMMHRNSRLYGSPGVDTTGRDAMPFGVGMMGV